MDAPAWSHAPCAFHRPSARINGAIHRGEETRQYALRDLGFVQRGVQFLDRRGQFHRPTKAASGAKASSKTNELCFSVKFMVVLKAVCWFVER